MSTPASWPRDPLNGRLLSAMILGQKENEVMTTEHGAELMLNYNFVCTLCRHYIRRGYESQIVQLANQSRIFSLYFPTPVFL